jgi:hypothetical protein
MDCAPQYKFYGPHIGVLYGKYDLLERLQAYKVRPAPDDPPGKYETGTHPSGATKASRAHLRQSTIWPRSVGNMARTMRIAFQVFRAGDCISRRV